MKPLLRALRKLMPTSLYLALVKPFVNRVLHTLFGARGIKVNIGGQGEFRFSPEYMFRRLEKFGSGHNGGFAECIQACAGKACFLDLGAHIGYYSLPASRVLQPGGKVYAFEPDHKNHALLSRHLRYNEIVNVELVNSLVGESAASGVDFYEHKVSGSPFGGVVVNRKKAKDAFTVSKKEQVCLDEFCESRGIVPDVIKIDVEGAELGVLRGARRILERGNPTVFLSLHPSHLELMGQSVGEVTGLMESLGFELLSVGGDQPWRPGSNECVCVKKNVLVETGKGDGRGYFDHR